MTFRKTVDALFRGVANAVFSYGIITLVAALTCATAAMYTVDFEDYASDLTPTALHSDPLFSHLLTGPSAMKWKAEIMFLGAQFVSLTTGMTITRANSKGMWAKIIGSTFFLTWVGSLCLWLAVGHRHNGVSKDLTIAAGSVTSVMAFFAFCVDLTQWIGSKEWLSTPLSTEGGDSGSTQLMHPLLARPISLLYPISSAIMLTLYAVAKAGSPSGTSYDMLVHEWILSTFIASQLVLYWFGISVTYERNSESEGRKNRALIPAALLWIGLLIATCIETQEKPNTNKFEDLEEIVGIFEISFAIVLAVGLNEHCKNATSTSGEYTILTSTTGSSKSMGYY